ncbi:MAG: SprT-like domain-containing protein, partial [Trebonia sp.]
MAQYRSAAEMLWGDAGRHAVNRFADLNRAYWAGALLPTPIVIGLTSYGRADGLTRCRRQPGQARITLASRLFANLRRLDDVLLHEMVHLELALAGRDTGHNTNSWCRRTVELSLPVLGHAIAVAPV